jgi:hypothetical protein
LNAELFVTLLRKMMRHRSRPIHLVVNGLPAHKTKLVKDYVQSTKGRVTLHFLPGYAPELNPDELVWSHVKRTGVAPPIIALIPCDDALTLLAPGGVAVFQVPTYCRGYRFNTAEYLASLTGSGDVDMHGLPQATVFRVAQFTGSSPRAVCRKPVARS